MSGYSILIADDEAEMVSLLTSYLEKEGYSVYQAQDGYEAVKQVERESVDLVVLDIMMPRMDGFTACKKIREKSTIPILMLTAKGDEWDRIHGLKIGADDYMVKPFSPKEFIARVEALLRRTHHFKNASQSFLTCNELLIDINRYSVKVNQDDVNLTRKEFHLLAFLVENKGQVFSREHLFDRIWGMESKGTTRTVDTHIKTLRLKIGSAGEYIKTVWGVGYKFED
ncbi:response regulator transcription factor [Bacillus taeanensis]|uniref:DNA-binding response regulator n=1 Tax=Bacillus taeanensis TaxID=273032 RepID=A0A366XY04_9BACI|nr:response regulator transcription factor [Bacillus taeanensis]RBW69649.1 DNA-binding response regulator [Bacillus taeanensis]